MEKLKKSLKISKKNLGNPRKRWETLPKTLGNHRRKENRRKPCRSLQYQFAPRAHPTHGSPAARLPGGSCGARLQGSGGRSNNGGLRGSEMLFH